MEQAQVQCETGYDNATAQGIDYYLKRKVGRNASNLASGMEQSILAKSGAKNFHQVLNLLENR